MRKKPQKYSLEDIRLNSTKQLDLFFNPTIKMAADLMNVSVSVVSEWLGQEQLITEGDDKLSDDAIIFLSEKYVSRMHRYFDNCVASWDFLDTTERSLFSQFKRRYGKFFHLSIEEWGDIDTRRIAGDFIDELLEISHDVYLEGFEPFHFPRITVRGYNRLDTRLDLYLHSESKGRSYLLFSISHSLYYGSRLKTRIPATPGHRDIVLEILQENRFHIFTGESEDNVQIDAISLFFNVNQPQLAIVPVFGYQRRKSNNKHEGFHENQTHFCCPA